ncbi:hypothetical protein [Candidatus Tisiphia endosymbiont of Nemotelus uliginosus]|uniref:hypothetical protein n=1 Tax=Candidatus Tisiphia endosymbiont of Nemotelus uliginosus TaxID=3077926 RepID=UPI0035C92547
MLKPPKQPLKTRFTEQNKTETSTSKVGSAAKWQDNYAELPEPNEKLSNQSITEGPEIQPLLPKLNSQHTGDPEFRTRQQTVINQLTNYVKQPNLKASFSKTPPKPAQLSPAEASDVSPDKLSREQPMPAPALPPKPTHLQTKANENTPKVKWRDDHGGPLSDTIELEEHSTLSQEATIKANPYAAAFSTDTAFNEAISPPPTKTNGTGDRSTISLLITELNALQHLLKHNHTASQAIDPSSELEQSSYLPTTVANTQTLPEDPTPLVGEESPITQ